MGKTGIIAQKFSATLASTGTPSLFLHTAEAIHGDLGMVVDEDVVIMLSKLREREKNLFVHIRLWWSLERFVQPNPEIPISKEIHP